jgi:hypothetical protein
VNRKKNKVNRIIIKKIGIAISTSNKVIFPAGSKKISNVKRGSKVSKNK